MPLPLAASHMARSDSRMAASIFVISWLSWRAVCSSVRRTMSARGQRGQSRATCKFEHGSPHRSRQTVLPIRMADSSVSSFHARLCYPPTSLSSPLFIHSFLSRRTLVPCHASILYQRCPDLTGEGRDDTHPPTHTTPHALPPFILTKFLQRKKEISSSKIMQTIPQTCVCAGCTRTFLGVYIKAKKVNANKKKHAGLQAQAHA